MPKRKSNLSHTTRNTRRMRGSRALQHSQRSPRDHNENQHQDTNHDLSDASANFVKKEEIKMESIQSIDDQDNNDKEKTFIAQDNSGISARTSKSEPCLTEPEDEGKPDVIVKHVLHERPQPQQIQQAFLKHPVILSTTETPRMTTQSIPSPIHRTGNKQQEAKRQQKQRLERPLWTSSVNHAHAAMLMSKNIRILPKPPSNKEKIYYMPNQKMALTAIPKSNTSLPKPFLQTTFGVSSNQSLNSHSNREKTSEIIASVSHGNGGICNNISSNVVLSCNNTQLVGSNSPVTQAARSQVKQAPLPVVGPVVLNPLAPQTFCPFPSVPVINVPVPVVGVPNGLTTPSNHQLNYVGCLGQISSSAIPPIMAPNMPSKTLSNTNQSPCYVKPALINIGSMSMMKAALPTLTQMLPTTTLQAAPIPIVTVNIDKNPKYSRLSDFTTQSILREDPCTRPTVHSSVTSTSTSTSTSNKGGTLAPHTKSPIPIVTVSNGNTSTSTIRIDDKPRLSSVSDSVFMSDVAKLISNKVQSNSDCYYLSNNDDKKSISDDPLVGLSFQGDISTLMDALRECSVPLERIQAEKTNVVETDFRKGRKRERCKFESADESLTRSADSYSYLGTSEEEADKIYKKYKMVNEENCSETSETDSCNGRSNINSVQMVKKWKFDSLLNKFIEVDITENSEDIWTLKLNDDDLMTSSRQTVYKKTHASNHSISSNENIDGVRFSETGSPAVISKTEPSSSSSNTPSSVASNTLQNHTMSPVLSSDVTDVKFDIIGSSSIMSESELMATDTSTSNVSHLQDTVGEESRNHFLFSSPPGLSVNSNATQPDIADCDIKMEIDIADVHDQNELSIFKVKQEDKGYHFSSEDEADVFEDEDGKDLTKMDKEERKHIIIKRRNEKTMFILQNADRFSIQKDGNYCCNMCKVYHSNGLFRISKHLRKHFQNLV